MLFRSGLFFIIPKDKLENEIGEDLNATSSSRLLSIVTRVGLNITGPDVLGAKSSAKIETDLSAFTGNTAALRLRQAWAKLSWDKTELLVGQAWHPMFGDLLPTVMSLGTGCPFQPFNRSPQIRFDYKFCNKSRIYLSALYQMQYNSIGPNGSSAEYLTNGILPELFLGSDYKTEKWLIGAGVDFMRIRPRLYGEKIYEIDGVETNIKIKVSDYVSSFSAMAFAQYKNDKLTIKAKTILGQNLSNQLMLSGYGVSKIKDDGSYEYTNINTTTSWLNITYGKKVQVGIFGGYTKNLGTSDRKSVV